MVKQELFVDTDLARRVVGVRFSTGDPETIRKIAHIPIFNNKLYDDSAGKWSPAQYGPLDTRLGTFQKTLNCETCKKNMTDCVGHYGFVDLELPVFHVGFFRLTIQMLQCLCKNCSNFLITGEKKENFFRQVKNPNLDYLRRKGLHKKIVETCKKVSICPHCGFKNGVVKKAVGAVLKIAHGDPIDTSKGDEFAVCMSENKDLAATLPSIKFALLDPMQVHNILIKVKVQDYPLLLVRAGDNIHTPKDVIVTRVIVPPVCIRPSVISDIKSGSTEDDLTMKLTEIMLINDVIKKHICDGAPMKLISETWDHLQVQCALYINSELSGLPAEMQPKKVTRGFAQRLKGKHGRFRGNLSGKRVDFSGRTVISPDPNLKIDQVGVPIHVAKILTFPEIVTTTNIEKMKQLVRNGESKHPGANHLIEAKTGMKKFLKYGDREKIAMNLRPGDIIERHLDDDDVVLFNRQPSLHKISIMSHRAKVVPGRTFRFNECACTPYNADFDGDEMNLHLPQTYEAKAEASTLMGVKYNLITPRSGEPLIAAIQDFITGAYLLTHKDTFLPRCEVQRFTAAIIDITSFKNCNGKKGTKRIVIPPPAIRKPVELWTGKQLIELIIKDDQVDVKLNLRTKNKSYVKDDEFCPKDSFVVIRNSQLLCGVLDKSLVGSGSKSNIFYILMRDFGEDVAINAMWKLARMAPVFLSNRGFSIGIGDVTPSKQLLEDKAKLLNEGYTKCDGFIRDLKENKLKAQPGCTSFETLEALILKELSSIRDHAGQACLRNLSKHNAPLTMAISGSKGSFINISQMIACVGQQAISGNRPPDGFENRSLPHFERNQKTPDAKGFVGNSFYSGLTPTEFFFHTMAGREGLVDTAVKTAETGYMQRRLVKCLEDLCAAYDDTVRSSTGDIVQFKFGEDLLDPSMMESKDGSMVDYEHCLDHVKNTTPLTDDHLQYESYDKVLKVFIDEANKCIKRPEHQHFKKKFIQFIEKKLSQRKHFYDMPWNCNKHKLLKEITSCKDCNVTTFKKINQLRAYGMSKNECINMVKLCSMKLHRAITEPGTAVGAVAATSIGEPSTQMTLKTFHFAGVASMNITQGVPRIKEIINAVKLISTPIITATLVNDKDEKLARRVKSRIEKTTLGEVSAYIEEFVTNDDCFIIVKLMASRIRLLQLEVTMDTIIASICSAKLPVSVKASQIRVIGKSILMIEAPESKNIPSNLAIQYLKNTLKNVVIKGLPNVSRCVIHADEKKGDSYKLLVEGTDFREVLATPEIDGRYTNFNNALFVADVLGIEAARTCIINEILSTMESHGIGLDRRHVMLLADLMTYRGEVLGITRNGLVKMKESVLLLASFEKTTDHLFEAAFFGQEDKINGVSECIIMGAPITIGTGLFKLLFKREKLNPAYLQPSVPFISIKCIENFNVEKYL
uniref:DNA-directed RNA polymerase subunit n=1 Tax=Strongyloides venezuelensis TaxID=75913 RepID=A0A0K0FAM9_STRVS